MSAPQFTPGPWSFNDDWKLAPWSYALNVMDAKDRWVASTTRGWEGNGEDENSAGYANANLIAAAPELYEALADFIAAHDSGDPGLQMTALVEGRAALAKALGNGSDQ